MSVRIAFLGDIVGAPGRLAVMQCMGELRRRYRPNVVLANAENAANGSGLTPGLYEKLRSAGVDAMTLGDHVYRKKQIVTTLQSETRLTRPANLPAAAAGRGWMRLKLGNDDAGRGLYVITLLGRLFMNLPVNHPFEVVDRVLSQLPEAEPIVVVEMHAEATSEKQAMGWHLNGRVAAVIGTHTHVPTADARILPAAPAHGPAGAPTTLGAAGGTAYITDVGMCGPYDSVLGRRIDRVLTHMVTSMPAPFDVAEGDPRVCGALIEIDTATRRATAIERIELPADATRPPFAGGGDA